jgi:hypothetical protein
MVVSDLTGTLAALHGRYGLGPFHTSDDSYAARLHGVDFTLSLRVGFGWLGDTLLEVLQPLDGDSPHAHFLSRHGPGLHHVCWLVASVDDYVAATRSVITLDGHGAAGLHRWAYLEPVAGGLVPEIIEDTPSSAAVFADIRRAIGATAGDGRH